MSDYDAYAPTAAKWLLPDGTVTDKLPVSGGGSGGGVNLDDISASAPATWDSANGVIGVDTSGFATSQQGDKADTAVQPTALNDYVKTADLPVADHVDPETGTLADVVASLVAAGLMNSA